MPHRVRDTNRATGLAAVLGAVHSAALNRET
jgi:hypothetical protein